MPQVAILQMTNGEPEIDTSAATYATCVQQWDSLPSTRSSARNSEPGWRPYQPCAASRGWRFERIFDVEGSLLIDASVAGLAAQHLPFLYTVLGEVFDELGPEFRRALQREAARAEKAYEDDTKAQMAESGTEDRLDAVLCHGERGSRAPPGTARTCHDVSRGTGRGGYLCALQQCPVS